MKLLTLILDPGLAFGTGTHATTHLCLLWLLNNVNKNVTVLDYGCGSGILGIAQKNWCKKSVWVILIASYKSSQKFKINNVEIDGAILKEK